MAGLSLPQLYRAEANAGSKLGHKAVIMIFLPGGPSHQDMFDLKPDAPSEIRGEFKPISTNVAGIQICEHLPLMARWFPHYHLETVKGGGHWPHSEAPAAFMTAFAHALDA